MILFNIYFCWDPTFDKTQWHSFLLPATHFHSITALLWAHAAALHESVSQSQESEQVVSVMHHSSLDRNSHYLQAKLPAALLLARWIDGDKVNKRWRNTDHSCIFCFFAVCHSDKFGGGTKLNLCCWKGQFNTANLWPDRCLIHTKGLIKVKLSDRSWISSFKMYFQMRLFYLFYHVSLDKALLTFFLVTDNIMTHVVYN